MSIGRRKREREAKAAARAKAVAAEAAVETARTAAELAAWLALPRRTGVRRWTDADWKAIFAGEPCPACGGEVRTWPEAHPWILYDCSGCDNSGRVSDR